MQDFTEYLLHGRQYLRLQAADGFDWRQHLALAVLAASNGDFEASDTRSRQAADAYAATAQRLSSRTEERLVAMQDQPLRSVVMDYLGGTSDDLESVYDATLRAFKERASALLVRIVPVMRDLAQANDLNMLTSVFMGVAYDLPWGRGALFIQEQRAAGRVTTLVTFPAEYKFHSRPMTPATVPRVEAEAAKYVSAVRGMVVNGRIVPDAGFEEELARSASLLIDLSLPDLTQASPDPDPSEFEKRFGPAFGL